MLILTILHSPNVNAQSGTEASTEASTGYTTDAQSYAFIITYTSFKAVTLNTSLGQLVSAVERFRADEKQADGLADISKMLIAPIIDDLKSSRLIVVPHNELNYLPFSALPIDDKTLGDQFAISYLPSATTLLYLPQKPKQSGPLLAFGNPAAAGEPALPFAETEVDQVSQIVAGKVYTGKDATRNVLLNQASTSEILYIAAHGTFNNLNPLFSALHLASTNDDSGLLEMHDIYGLDLTQSTEMVVLSACQTAVGSLSAGDEFTGLNRAFLYAGARSIVASLWSVDDQATSILMKAFFEARAKGMGDAEALQSAQSFLRTYQVDGKTPYTSPYYWAAFILTGEE